MRLFTETASHHTPAISWFLTLSEPNNFSQSEAGITTASFSVSLTSLGNLSHVYLLLWTQISLDCEQ